MSNINWLGLNTVCFNGDYDTDAGGDEFFYLAEYHLDTKAFYFAKVYEDEQMRIDENQFPNAETVKNALLEEVKDFNAPKKTWRIPVTFQMCGLVDVEAATLHEAMLRVQDDDNDFPLPSDKEYVEGSWELTHPIDEVELVRQCYNNGQEDD